MILKKIRDSYEVIPVFNFSHSRAKQYAPTIMFLATKGSFLSVNVLIKTLSSWLSIWIPLRSRCGFGDRDVILPLGLPFVRTYPQSIALSTSLSFTAIEFSPIPLVFKTISRPSSVCLKQTMSSVKLIPPNPNNLGTCKMGENFNPSF